MSTFVNLVISSRSKFFKSPLTSSIKIRRIPV